MPEAVKLLVNNTNILYRWKESFEEELESKSLSTDEKAKLKKLRKEKKELQMEKEILKKPAPTLQKK